MTSWPRPWATSIRNFFRSNPAWSDAKATRIVLSLSALGSLDADRGGYRGTVFDDHRAVPVGRYGVQLVAHALDRVHSTRRQAQVDNAAGVLVADLDGAGGFAELDMVRTDLQRLASGHNSQNRRFALLE